MISPRPQFASEMPTFLLMEVDPFERTTSVSARGVTTVRSDNSAEHKPRGSIRIFSLGRRSSPIIKRYIVSQVKRTNV